MNLAQSLLECGLLEVAAISSIVRLLTRNLMKAASSIWVQTALGDMVGILRVGGRWYGGVRACNVVHEVYNLETHPRYRVSACNCYLTFYLA